MAPTVPESVAFSEDDARKNQSWRLIIGNHANDSWKSNGLLHFFDHQHLDGLAVGHKFEAVLVWNITENRPSYNQRRRE